MEGPVEVNPTLLYAADRSLKTIPAMNSVVRQYIYLFRTRIRIQLLVGIGMPYQLRNHMYLLDIELLLMGRKRQFLDQRLRIESLLNNIE